MKNDCVFCAIAAGEIPCFKVYEDEKVLAYLDINPFSRGHVLVIPKEHSANLLETADEVLADLIVKVKKIAAHLKEVLPCAGFNILQNNGTAAGQTVGHLHFHIVPRYQDLASAQISFENHECGMEALAELAGKIRL